MRAGTKVLHFVYSRHLEASHQETGFLPFNRKYAAVEELSRPNKREEIEIHLNLKSLQSQLSFLLPYQPAVIPMTFFFSRPCIIHAVTVCNGMHQIISSLLS